ncbi:MAG: radical SAM protein [Desulfobacterales bacterium]|nr:MAG: radical SAM protein [Desulfobacterales bacterium]
MYLNRLFPKSYPSLDWIQVEISSYCNASCIYCPHFAYRKNWQNRYLPMETFRKLAPAFARTQLVYLQGWGEPFTHPRFFDMLRFAQKAGCAVGTTTNGTMLPRETIERLVNEGLDIIGFSLVGVDERNDSIRQGTRIKKVLECIEEIQRVRDKYGAAKPKIHIAYILLRSGLADLDRLPAFLANTGAEQTVVSSLSLAVSPAMAAEMVLATGKTEYEELKNRLIEVRDAAAGLGAEVHFHIITPEREGFHCRENCARAIVVGSEGSLSPCVMKQIPALGQNFFYLGGQKQLQQNLVFGHINADSLNRIWHRKEYRRFIRAYLRGEVPGSCRNCLKQFSDSLEPSNGSNAMPKQSQNWETLLRDSAGN